MSLRFESPWQPITDSEKQAQALINLGKTGRKPMSQVKETTLLEYVIDCLTVYKQSDSTVPSEDITTIVREAIKMYQENPQEN